MVPIFFVDTGEGGNSSVIIIAVVVPITVIFLLLVAVFSFRAKRKGMVYETEPLAGKGSSSPVIICRLSSNEYFSVFFSLTKLMKLFRQIGTILQLQAHFSLILRQSRQQRIIFPKATNSVKVVLAKSTRYSSIYA